MRILRCLSVMLSILYGIVFYLLYICHMSIFLHTRHILFKIRIKIYICARKNFSILSWLDLITLSTNLIDKDISGRLSKFDACGVFNNRWITVRLSTGMDIFLKLKNTHMMFCVCNRHICSAEERSVSHNDMAREKFSRARTWSRRVGAWSAATWLRRAFCYLPRS